MNIIKRIRFCQIISELEEQVGLVKDVDPQNAQQEIPNMSCMEGNPG